MARSRDIQYGIISILLDGNLHTISELATHLEVSYKTISRHLNDLARYYPIKTFIGGRNTGGVQLDNSFLNKKTFSLEEFKLILKGLEALQPTDLQTFNLIEKVKHVISKEYPHADTPAISSVRSKENGQVM